MYSVKPVLVVDTISSTFGATRYAVYKRSGGWIFGSKYPMTGIAHETVALANEELKEWQEQYTRCDGEILQKRRELLRRYNAK